MTRRHELDTHRAKLSEIRNIMHSMKTLAMMETHKLEKSIHSQSTISDTIQLMASDFLHFNPQVLPEIEYNDLKEKKPEDKIILVIGSQRGFCGDFNQRLIKKLEQTLSSSANTNTNTSVIAVGTKLHTLLSETTQTFINIEGAEVVEAVSGVVNSLANTLSEHRTAAPLAISLYVIHLSNHQNEPVTERLLPPFKDIKNNSSPHLQAPLLNLPARDFFLELTDYYLFNALHTILYKSLMIENQRRIQHLENATNHLDDKTEELMRKINALRQEEIIEEIEVILLSLSSQ